MTNQEEWKEFLGNLFSNAIAEHKSIKEHEYRKQRQEQIDEMLTTNLTEDEKDDEKDMVDEVLFELGAATEHETEIIYQQGLKDCVWILKSLGVLA